MWSVVFGIRLGQSRKKPKQEEAATERKSTKLLNPFICLNAIGDVSSLLLSTNGLGNGN